MSHHAQDQASDEATTNPSREEIETLCLLYAVGEGRRSLTDLTSRLGLSPALVGAVTESIQPLVTAELLELDEQGVTRTDAGARHLDDRLRGLGV